jgi:ribosomal protein L35
MGTKTNKSYKKRLKVTKNGKVLQRQPGMGHFNAKESRRGQMKRKRGKIFPITVKDLGQYLPYG